MKTGEQKKRTIYYYAMTGKTTLLKRFRMSLIFVSLLFVTLPAFSQSYIKDVPFISGSPTLIREVSPYRWLICHRTFFSSFFLVSDTGAAILHSMDFLGQDIRVNDFEVNGNWVFFCGESSDVNNPYALVGKFEISTFPNSTVYMYRIDRLKTLTKIKVDYGGPSGIRHAYMIGTDVDGQWYFVSATLPGFGLTGSFYYSEADDGHVNILDNITYTQNYVVVTGRNTNNSYGFLYYFQRPLYVGSPYATTARYSDIGYTVKNPILITRCEDDYLVTVSSNDNNHYICAYDSLTCKYMVYVNRYKSALEQDLVYIRDYKTLDILVGQPGQEENCFSYIYHLTTNNIGPGVSMFLMHDFTGEDIHSLRQSSESDPINYWVVASGTNCEYPQLHWYKYRNQSYRCSAKDVGGSRMTTSELNPEEYTFSPVREDIKPETLQTRIREYAVEVMCPEKADIDVDTDEEAEME